MGWLDDLIYGTIGTQAGIDATQSTLGGLGFVFWVLVVIVIGFSGLILGRYFWRRFSYEGAEEIAPYRVTWMGKFDAIEGNLSVNDSFDDEVMIQLQRHSDLKFVVDMIKHEIKTKKLFVYNFKVTDEGNIIDEFAKKVRIISPVDFQSLEYTWIDQKGKRNLGSLIRKERRRNIVIYHTSKKIEIINEDGNEEDWWVVSPIPMTEAKDIIKFNSESISPTPVHYIEILKIEGAKALAEMGSFAPTMAESIQKYLEVKNERDNFQKMYVGKVEELEDSNMQRNQLTHLLAQKKYVDYGKEEINPKSIMNFGWIVCGAFISYLFVKILPELLPSQNPDIVELTGLAIGIGIIGIIWRWYTESNKTPEQRIQERS